MTCDPSDFLSIVPTPRTKIQTANEECVEVTRVGTVDITSCMKLKNCRLIPSFTHKLLSITQLTKELNCTITMSSTDCFIQDAQTEK